MRYLILALTLLFFVLGSVRFLPAKAQTGDWTTYEDYDPLVMAGYSTGEWQSVADGNALGGQLTQTSTANATLTLYFQVTGSSGGYSLVYSKTTSGGDFKIELDDTTYGPFNSYAANSIYNQEVSHVSLPAGKYVLKIINGNASLAIEAIKIQGGVLLDSSKLGLALYYEEDFESTVPFNSINPNTGDVAMWRGDEIQLTFALTSAPLRGGTAMRYANQDVPVELTTIGQGAVVMKTDIYLESGVASFSFYNHLGDYYQVILGDGILTVKKNATILATQSIPFASSTWHIWEVYFRDGDLIVKLDNTEIIQIANEPNSFFFKMEFVGDRQAGHQFWLDNLDLWTTEQSGESSLAPLPSEEIIQGNTTNSASGVGVAGLIVYRHGLPSDYTAVESGIYLLNLDTNSDPIRLTHSFYDFSPVLSPSNDKVMFLRANPANTSQREFYVLDIVAALSGTGIARPITGYLHALAPDWSSQNMIAFHGVAPGGSDSHIWSFDYNDCDEIGQLCSINYATSLVPAQTGESDVFPAWSHDGTKLAFVSGRDWNGIDYLTRYTYVYDFELAQLKKLTGVNAPGDYYVGHFTSPQWSADDQQLAVWLNWRFSCVDLGEGASCPPPNPPSKYVHSFIVYDVTAANYPVSNPWQINTSTYSERLRLAPQLNNPLLATTGINAQLFFVNTLTGIEELTPIRPHFGDFDWGLVPPGLPTSTPSPTPPTNTPTAMVSGTPDTPTPTPTLPFCGNNPIIIPTNESMSALSPACQLPTATRSATATPTSLGLVYVSCDRQSARGRSGPSTENPIIFEYPPGTILSYYFSTIVSEIEWYRISDDNANQEVWVARAAEGLVILEPYVEGQTANCPFVTLTPSPTPTPTQTSTPSSPDCIITLSDGSIPLLIHLGNLGVVNLFSLISEQKGSISLSESEELVYSANNKIVDNIEIIRWIDDPTLIDVGT